jgi:hypothetical protein
LVIIYKIQSLYQPYTFAVAILFKRNALCPVLFNANFNTSVRGTETICSFTFFRDLICITFGMAYLTRNLTVVTILQLVTFLSDELRLPQAPSQTTRISAIQPISVAARSKAWGLRPFACWDCGFEFRWALNVCLFLVLCVVR